MQTYEFYMETRDGKYTWIPGLTKRQAVIRYNKAKYNPELVSAGWGIEVDNAASLSRALKAKIWAQNNRYS